MFKDSEDKKQHMRTFGEIKRKINSTAKYKIITVMHTQKSDVNNKYSMAG